MLFWTGPTLLFESLYKDQPPACSVYQDRKQCSFLSGLTQKSPMDGNDRKKRWKQLFEDNQLKISHKELMIKLETCKKLKSHKYLKYCTVCSTLVLPNELNDHKSHKEVYPITFYDILHPSKFIPAITSRKGEAVLNYCTLCLMLLHDTLFYYGMLLLRFKNLLSAHHIPYWKLHIDETC